MATLKAYEEEQRHGNNWLDLFRNYEMRKRMLLMILAWSVKFYSAPELLSSCGSVVSFGSFKKLLENEI